MMASTVYETEISVAGAQLYTWMERGTMRVKCLAQTVLMLKYSDLCVAFHRDLYISLMHILIKNIIIRFIRD